MELTKNSSAKIREIAKIYSIRVFPFSFFNQIEMEYQKEICLKKKSNYSDMSVNWKN